MNGGFTRRKTEMRNNFASPEADVKLRSQIAPMTRTEATNRAKRAGATVQDRVTNRTTLVVAGDPTSQMIGKAEGNKLFDASLRMRRGQAIAVITAVRFQKLLA